MYKKWREQIQIYDVNKSFTSIGNRKSCADKNECLDGSASCVNSNCRNTDGSYDCICLSGYQPSSDFWRCDPKSCSPLIPSQCPAGAYKDEFGKTCMPARKDCPSGLEYKKSCTLNCPSNYRLAVIAAAKPGDSFAQKFTTVDFASPSDRTSCTVDFSSGKMVWDWNPAANPYYCRRVNDPPLGITISKTTLNEKAAIFTRVGTLFASDPQGDRLSYSITNSEGNYYFLIQGNALLVKNRVVWNPSSEENTITVLVNVSDNGSPAMGSRATLNISVLNINDPPYAIELSNIEVDENFPVNHVVGNLTAIDDDVGPTRSLNFSWYLVDSDNGMFSLLGNKVLIAKSLDHEMTSFHRIQVRCADYGFPRKYSQVTTITINVGDSNDSPKYINLTRHRIAENSPAGTLVGRLVAIDDDNDTLSFDLNGTDEQVLEKFKLEGECVLIFLHGKFSTCFKPAEEPSF